MKLAVAVCDATLAGPATSRADFVLRVDFGNNGSWEHTITDNGAGDLDLTDGLILASTPGGGFTIMVNTGSSKPNLAPGHLDLANVSVSGGAGTVAIELTDTDFAGPSADYEFAAGGTTHGIVTFEAGGTSSNTEFDLSNSTGVMNTVPGGGNSFTAFGTFPSDGQNPYSLTIRAIITHAGAQDATSFNASLQPVPAPAGLILAATALPFVGLLRRRLRRPEATTAA